MSATVQAHGPVLVGVDGSTQNASAVAWAAAEAASFPGAVPLVLVHDTEGSGESSSVGRAILERALTEAGRLQPGLHPVTEVHHGGPQQSLRSATTKWSPSEDEDRGPAMLVVGRRGTGASRRVRLGMTARRLVHEPGPLTVVVPDGWSPRLVPRDAPVVVDLGDAPEDSDRALALALSRAAREGRRVVALLVWSVPPLAAGLDRAIREIWADYAGRAERALAALLEPWRTAYPGVELVGVPTDRHAVSALLDHADGAELLVVPRGDRACAIVEYADCPVAVV